MSDSSHNQTVSLGCGTLILIALIVIIFSDRGAKKVVSEVRELRQEVSRLTNRVEAQTAALETIQRQLTQQQRTEAEDAAP